MDDTYRLRVAGRTDEPFICDEIVGQGEAALGRGDRDAALGHFLRALRIGYRYGPAKAHVDAIARQIFSEAKSLNDVDLFVRAVELNPDDPKPRAALDRALAPKKSLFGRPAPEPFDLTKRSLAQWRPSEAESRYRQAIGRCVDFAASRGIDGDVLEFGVLGGWTARVFAEALRDTPYHCHLWLFDSFEGLPTIETDVDTASYDIRRGIWQQNMRLPPEMFAPSGLSLEAHIADRLSTVISRPRIHVRKGYFADTLADHLGCRAAIVHLDCDLYSSTAEVLAALDGQGVLQDGTLLMFDDWNCNRGNPNYGQRRAFDEFLNAREHYDASPFINYGPNAAVFILHDLRL